MMKNAAGCFGCGGLGFGLVALAGVAVAALGILAVSGYNKLVRLNEDVGKQWAQVQNVYQRRADLVPNLVATVKGAADFEKSTLQQVVEARARVGQINLGQGAPTAEDLAAFEKSQTELRSALSRLLVVVEQYPDLKATAAFRDLQAQLEGAENRITVERGRFNESAQALNTALHSFPVVLFKGWLSIKERPYFQAAPGAEQAPRVDFGS